MVDCEFFYDSLTQRGVDFFTGVPDSILKDFCAYITDHADSKKHITAANEGGAIGLASGYYLATGKIALVYMQNSGQGNAINPLVSLADPDVYCIPMVLLIAWRGEPGKKDQPEHIKQGKITLSLLDTLGVRYRILPETNTDARECLEEILDMAGATGASVALIVRKGTFSPYQQKEREDLGFELTREQAIKLIVDKLADSDIVVSTTGKTSRELYEYRDALDGNHSKDFLTVGSMGHACQIALGIALSKLSRQVFCFDGDGAAIMHMGSLAIIGSQKAKNFRHIIFNNGSHDSVGGEPTAGFAISLTDIAKACSYKIALRAETAREVADHLEVIRSVDGPALLEIRVRKGARADLGRPKISPRENKIRFMQFLSK